MSAVVVEHPFRHALTELRQLVCEATALGVTFRISGASVIVAFPEPFPRSLRARLCEYRDSGWLSPYLGAERLDEPAKVFAAELGIAAVVITTREQVPAAIWQLQHDLTAFGGHLGLDIETSPRLALSRPAIRFNNDGTVAERQPKWKNDAGLDPHRATIASLQLYAGGELAAAAARLLSQLRLFRPFPLVPSGVQDHFGCQSPYYLLIGSPDHPAHPTQAACSRVFHQLFQCVRL